MLSNLQGVTVRNTFVELDDPGEDSIFSNSAFARQSSEPAWPVHRGEDQGPLAYETHSRKKLSEVAPVTGGRQGAAPQSPLDVSCAKREQFSTGSFTKSMSMMSPGACREAFMPWSNNLPAVRICPSCGAQAKVTHRFCAYCRFQFHGVRNAIDDFGNNIWDKSASGLAGDSTDLLVNLRRLRYMEAMSSDVDRARALADYLMGIGCFS